MSARVNRRRFLELSAMTAAGGVFAACAPAAPRTASNPTEAPAKPADASKPAEAAKPTEAAKPAAQAPAAAPTSAPLAVSNAAPTAAATAAPAAAGAASKYKESPDLADLVKAGKLPPVDQRIPTNPRVIKPLEMTGQYGGTWRRAFRGLADYLGVGKLMEARLIAWDAPDPNTLRVVPNVLEKWEQISRRVQFTFYLRKGLKWSDGNEISTDDVKFWWEEFMGNTDVNPVVPLPGLTRMKINGECKPATLTIVDKYTWKVKYPTSNPLLPIGLAKNNGNNGHANVMWPGFLIPTTWAKQYLPKFANGGKDALDTVPRRRAGSPEMVSFGLGGAGVGGSSTRTLGGADRGMQRV